MRAKVREQIRALGKKLWKPMLADNSRPWKSRLVILYEFTATEATTWKAVRADILATGCLTFQGLFGWAGASLSSGRPVASSSSSSSAPGLRRAQSSGPVAQKRSLESVLADTSLKRESLFGKEMVGLPDALGLINTPACKRAKPTIGEKLPRWQKRFQWPAHSFAKSEITGSKGGGGSRMWMITASALADVYKIM